MSYNLQAMDSLSLTRTFSVRLATATVLQSHAANQPAGFYVQMGTGAGRVSHLKVKRPDGTWATIFAIAGVHIQKDDGSWEVFD